MAEFVWDKGALDELFASTSGPVAKMLKRKGIVVQNRAKTLCPVDTGRLRSSIAEELRRDGDELVERIGTDVDYALYVEMGTSRAGAQPYLRPALDAAKGVT